MTRPCTGCGKPIKLNVKGKHRRFCTPSCKAGYYYRRRLARQNKDLRITQDAHVMKNVNGEYRIVHAYLEPLD